MSSEVIAGFHEVTDVRTGVTTRTPTLRPLADLQRERAAELQRAIRDHVDAHLPPSEQVDVANIAAGLARRAMLIGLTDTERGVLVGLALADEWAMRAYALGGEVAARCAACSTVEELEAVTVDLGELGPPPTVTAGEIALALREG